MSLLNKTQCKRAALELAKNRTHKFTRVSEEFTDALEVAVQEIIRSWVSQLPSVGKTVYSPTRRVEGNSKDPQA